MPRCDPLGRRTTLVGIRGVFAGAQNASSIFTTGHFRLLQKPTRCDGRWCSGDSSHNNDDDNRRNRSDNGNHHHQKGFLEKEEKAYDIQPQDLG
mmetsp:Transcript_83862/g.125723  ORF Transcript_83862/g.125723 Transcript_83862/m.125723 type:complete len:94 (-) Transcript_83862:637-918(-)